jgi:hypothetical protein
MNCNSAVLWIEPFDFFSPVEATKTSNVNNRILNDGLVLWFSTKGLLATLAVGRWMLDHERSIPPFELNRGAEMCNTYVNAWPQRDRTGLWKNHAYCSHPVSSTEVLSFVFAATEDNR